MSSGFTDRRTSPRVPSRLPVGWSDHFYEWSGEALNVGPGGAFVVGTPLDPGKILRVTVQYPDQEPLSLDATVAHADGGGMGLAFRLPDTLTFARSAEAFERHVARDPELVARSKRSAQPLDGELRLWPTERALLAGAARSADERRVIRMAGPGVLVRELRQKGGASLAPAVFALLERDLLTTSEQRAARGAPAPWSGETAAPAPRTGARPAAAERYFQQALEQIARGQDQAAVTALKLALVLSPEDPQIEAALRRLDQSRW